MESVVLVIHLFLALAIIGLVLIQRSEGGGLGIGGGNGGMGNLATARGTANLLTRITGVCAFAFFTTSLLLGIMAGHDSRGKQEGLLEGLSAKGAVEAPVDATTQDKKADPAAPVDTGPTAPVAE